MPDAPKPPPPGQKPRQPSRPEISVDKTVGAGKSYAASQDHVRPELIRKGTLIGVGKLAPPPLPPAKTMPAPSTSAPTVRPAPAMGIRIPVDETPTTGRPGASLPPPSADHKDAQIAALRARAEAAEKARADERDKVAGLLADKAELERQARVAAESKRPGPYQVPLVPTPTQRPAPQSEAALETAAIEGVLVWLAKRAAANRKAIYGIVAALGLGGGGALLKTANEKPPPPALTKADLDVALDKLKTRKGGFDDQTRLLNEQLQLTKCLRRKVKQIGEAMLPAPDHQGAARKIQPFEDDCEDSPKPLPDP